MATIYESFLRSPNPSLLASDASINYITTTTTIKGAEAIVKHLQAQEKQLQKKAEKVLSTTSSPDGICLETETTFVFREGGGAILPNMDVNMLADMTAVLPMVHVVSLDASRRISQIRIYWDQGTILKQVDAIGKTGRNWPIRDGKEQTQLVKASIDSVDVVPAAAPVQTSNGRMPDEYTKRLFDTSSDEPRARMTSEVEPRESSKPQERQWGELFPGEDSGYVEGQHGRSQYAPVLKSGAGKNYKPSRLFDEADPNEREPSPERRKVDPTKNDHFEWGNGEDALPTRNNRPLSKAGQKSVSSWDLDDVSTPPRQVQRHNPEQERHIGYGIDAEHGPSPPKRPIVHAPRPDANTHFEITDASTPDHGKKPLSTMTNINAARRHADYDPHFSLKDTSSPPAVPNENARPVSSKGAAAQRNDMVSSWDLAQMGQETPGQPRKIYKTAGDGMGGRVARTSFWDVAGSDEPEQYGGKGGVKQVYKTAGNGMGGRKGQVGLGWSIGDPDAE